MLKILAQKLSYLLVWVGFYVLGISDVMADQSLGEISSGLMEPVSVLTRTVYNICYVLGGTLLLGALIQYKTYRDNPSHMPISRPIFLAILGLVILSIPFIGHLSAGHGAANGYY